MIKPMARVQIIGLREQLVDTIALLQKLGLVQLEDSSLQPEFGLRDYHLSESDEQEKAALELNLVSVEGLLERFQSVRLKHAELARAEVMPDLDDARQKLAEVQSSVQTLLQERTANREALTVISRYRETIKMLTRKLPPAAADPSNNVFTAIIRSTAGADLTAVEEKLRGLPGNAQIKTLRLALNSAWITFTVIYPLDRQMEVEPLLKAGGLFEVTLPEAFSPRQPEEALHEINQAVIANKSALTALDARMKALAAKKTLTLKALRVAILNRIQVMDALTLAGISEDTFHLIGWCLQEDTAQLEKEISAAFGGLVSVLEVAIPENQTSRIPVATSSNAFLQPYKEIVNVRSVPSYQDVDPTGLMAFFLPLFFGFMVSDIGYGALIFGVAMLIRKVKVSGLIGSLLKTFWVGALWSIAFGVLFGEFFGNLGIKMGMHPILFAREDPTKTTLLLEIAVGIGVVQVMLGALIGAWNGLRHRETKHMLENAGTFMALAGVVLLGGGLAGILPDLSTTIGGLLIATGLIGTASTIGLTGIFLAPIEFIGVLGSILSYLRLAALGLASVFLAEVANELAGKLGGIVVGILVAAVIHAINIVMAMFSPTIQSMRLQFVEFFRRFYRGGGREFTPFKTHELE